jgi:hypothetical protein
MRKTETETLIHDFPDSSIYNGSIISMKDLDYSSGEDGELDAETW